jgi:hypothetical protein
MGLIKNYFKKNLGVYLGYGIPKDYLMGYVQLT